MKARPENYDIMCDTVRNSLEHIKTEQSYVLNKELAYELGISESEVSQLLNGRKLPNYVFLWKLKEKGFSINPFFGIEEESAELPIVNNVRWDGCYQVYYVNSSERYKNLSPSQKINSGILLLGKNNVKDGPKKGKQDATFVIMPRGCANEVFREIKDLLRHNRYGDAKNKLLTMQKVYTGELTFNASHAEILLQSSDGSLNLSLYRPEKSKNKNAKYLGGLALSTFKLHKRNVTQYVHRMAISSISFSNVDEEIIDQLYFRERGNGIDKDFELALAECLNPLKVASVFSEEEKEELVLAKLKRVIQNKMDNEAADVTVSYKEDQNFYWFIKENAKREAS